MFTLLSIASGLRLSAQTTSASSISGTITDSSGAVIAGVAVDVTNPAIQVSRTTVTNNEGFYSVEAIIAGRYQIQARKPGFRETVIKDVVLAPSQRLEQNFSMEVGEVQSTVSVEATAVAVQTENAETGGVVTAKQVENLLVNGRNFLSLGLLVPGVNSAASNGRVVGGGSLTSGGLTGETPLSINGLGREFSLYTIDGAYDMNTGNNVNLNISPPLPAISEFRIAVGNYSAKYGVSGSAQVLVETKSGTTQYHGEAYEFLRNDAFDANNFFSGGQKTPLKQNIFGFALGGPVQIPKLYNRNRDRGTFFFVNEEWRAIHAGQTLRGSLFPQAIRNGDFTNSPTLKGGALKLDSTAQKFLASRGNCLLSATQINPSCFDPNAVKLMNQFWPLPNNPSGGFINYINPGVDITDQVNHTYRVDQYLGNRFALMGRFMYEEVNDSGAALTWGPNPAPTTTQSIYTTGLNALIRLTATIKPTVVNTTSLVETYDKPRLTPINATLPAGLTIQPAFPNADPLHRIPTINVSGGWAGLGTGVLPIAASDGEGTFSDDLNVVKGDHILQAGVLYIWGIKRQNLFVTNQGSYNFTGVHTGDPAADYLLGLDSSYLQNNGNRRGYFHYRQFEPYFQDDWKVTKRLTLNLGLRYVYISPDTVDGNAMSSFSPAQYQPGAAPAINLDGTIPTNAAGQALTPAGTPANLLNGIIFAGKNGVPPGFFNARKLDFAPRFGFAWDPAGDGRTAIRGGYAIGYSRIPFDIYGAYSNPPYLTSTNLLNGTLTNPAAGTASALTSPSLTVIPPDYRPTQVQTWSFTVQRQLFRNAVWTVGYVGSAGRHIKGLQDINFVNPVAQPSSVGCLAPGQTIPQGGFSFDPCINSSVASADYTRPYKGFSSLSQPYTSGNSNYHSLQTSFQYRTGPLQVNANYTWGKALTDVANRGYDGRNSNASAQNPRDFAAEYGPPGWDRRHIFTIGYVYELPFFRSAQGIVNKALGNWTLSGITVAESGFAVSPSLSTGNNGLASRPNIIGPLNGSQTLAEWFNTAAFAAPLPGFFGNAGNGIIRAPHEQTWNIALFKTFAFTERVRFQLRGEAFNIWNHPNFDRVDTAYGSGSFGQVTDAMEPRILEIAVKFMF